MVSSVNILAYQTAVVYEENIEPDDKEKAGLPPNQFCFVAYGVIIIP